MLQGSILFFLIAGDMIYRFRIRRSGVQMKGGR
jgi:simple sugar transport system permease protein